MKKMIFCVFCAFCVDVTSVRAQIPIDQVQILNSPDVRSWPATATISKIEFWRGAGIHFEFDRNAAWPDVVPEGWNGPIQYTVWILVNVNGRWYGSGIIECWRDRQSTDDTDVTENNQIARNWLYDSRWGPMQGHQPQPGERVGFMLTAGDARGRDVHGVTERSRILEIAWPSASGSAAEVLWVEEGSVDLRPTLATSVPPLATSVPTQLPPSPPASPLPSVDLTPVMTELALLNAKVDALTLSETQFHAQVHDAWEKTGAVFLKYIAPALAAFFGGKALQ